MFIMVAVIGYGVCAATIALLGAIVEYVDANRQAKAAKEQNTWIDAA